MKLIECPRDAMQGFPHQVPTALKISYLQQLLAVGFDTLDFGSYVSPKAIPQLADTPQVLAALDMSATTTRLLAIVANVRGAEQALAQEKISFIGYPLSLSEIFQQRNTHKSIAEAFQDIARIQDLCYQQNKTLVTYLSMGFGNPYQEPWSTDIVLEFVQRLVTLNVSIISLSDTVGLAQLLDIQQLFTYLIPTFPQVEFGAHLHVQPRNWQAKVAAAVAGGCTRFDGALRGFGGCPLATDELTGNLATENLVAYFENNAVPLKINKQAFRSAWTLAETVFTS
ncbi:beta/alpha barrel domain-containing protein [Adhaeribacter pallidiroseus]|uniref:Hydroxymethylglutaryl-CoA lyase n=1 Tax=Adhaeribacter pallidiroseus TaxID=2072847 RepID=A0A369QJT0_9BACT|nr:hydroxymethylglutaryl-CoA lyase [Adhaeribacter pallidiroseus]RDC65171.1 Hydroxymethylglutaryl-CoA lyase [Adhaeribacter pallidiroseus]